METQLFWRLVKSRYVATAFDGYGARTFGGRWNSRGRECVYLGSSKALCVLETLVHLEIEDIAEGYSFLTIAIPTELIATLDLDTLPISTQQIGDQWLADVNNGLLLRVPSTITGEWNALFNPEHPEAKTALLSVKAEPFIIDPRLGKRC